MIAFPAGVKVWIAGGVTDMRCGMNTRDGSPVFEAQHCMITVMITGLHHPLEHWDHLLCRSILLKFSAGRNLPQEPAEEPNVRKNADCELLARCAVVDLRAGWVKLRSFAERMS